MQGEGEGETRVILVDNTITYRELRQKIASGYNNKVIKYEDIEVCLFAAHSPYKQQ